MGLKNNNLPTREYAVEVTNDPFEHNVDNEMAMDDVFGITEERNHIIVDKMNELLKKFPIDDVPGNIFPMMTECSKIARNDNEFAYIIFQLASHYKDTEHQIESISRLEAIVRGGRKN